MHEGTAAQGGSVSRQPNANTIAKDNVATLLITIRENSHQLVGGMRTVADALSGPIPEEANAKTPGMSTVESQLWEIIGIQRSTIDHMQRATRSLGL